MIMPVILIAAIICQACGILSVNLSILFVFSLALSMVYFLHFAALEELKNAPAMPSPDPLLPQIAEGTKANSQALQALLAYIQSLPKS